MLTNALRVLVYNPIKENFYGKRKKKKKVAIMWFFSLPPKFDMKLELYHVINQVIDYYFAKIMDGKSYFYF